MQLYKTMNHSCDEFRAMQQAAMSRRSVLRAGLGLGAGLAAFPRLALGSGAVGGGGTDTILFVMLRGGLDGLTLVAPYGDPNYAAFRPTIAIRPPGPGGALDLNGFFGLAPAAAALLEPYQAGDLAFVHAVGNSGPIVNRSHFSSQYLLETATPNTPGGTITSGWLARHLKEVPPVSGLGMRGLAIDALMPRTLFGAPATVAIPQPELAQLPGPRQAAAARRAALLDMYSSEVPLLRKAAEASADTVDVLQDIDFEGYSPSGDAVYPATTFGTALQRSAAIIKADVGAETLEVDLGGWDFHAGMGPEPGGAMGLLMAEFAQGLGALWRDCQDELGRLTVVAFSEFGRRVDENGSLGTDHGRGGAMLVLGGNVNGGQVFGTWPGLALPQQDDFALAVTSDYRDVLSEVLHDRAGNTTQAEVFPDYTPTFLGVTE